MHVCPTPNQGLRVPMTQIFRTRKDLINQAILHDGNALAPIHHKRNNDGASPAQSVQPPTIPGAIRDFDQTHHLDTCGELLRLQGRPSPGQTEEDCTARFLPHSRFSRRTERVSMDETGKLLTLVPTPTFCRRFFHHVPDHISSHFHNLFGKLHRRIQPARVNDELCTRAGPSVFNSNLLCGRTPSSFARLHSRSWSLSPVGKTHLFCSLIRQLVSPLGTALWFCLSCRPSLVYLSFSMALIGSNHTPSFQFFNFRLRFPMLPKKRYGMPRQCIFDVSWARILHTDHSAISLS